MARDPVCGMDVDEATAKEKYEYKGTTYYFCSRGCRLDFQDEPEKYLSGKDGGKGGGMHGAHGGHGRQG